MRRSCETAFDQRRAQLVRAPEHFTVHGFTLEPQPLQREAEPESAGGGLLWSGRRCHYDFLVRLCIGHRL